MVSPQGDPTKQIIDLDDEHVAFISDEEELKGNLFGIISLQVKATEKCLIYCNGRLVKQLGPGPHRWWKGFLRTWKMQRVNMRVELMSMTVKGRVKGPPMPRETPGAAAVDLACDVTASLDLVCKLADVQSLLQYSNPISVFQSSIKNMVVEMIGRLPYDQYGEWATQLRDQIKDRLTQYGRDNSERLLGIRVEDVYVKEFRPNTAHDRNMMANYQLVERARRELAESQAKAQTDIVAAQSFRTQGEILNVAPAILALQKSPLGEALINRDADLKKLVIGAGLNPGVNIQPLQDPTAQLSSGQPATQGYLNPPSQSGPIQGTNPLQLQPPAGSWQYNSQPSAPLPPVNQSPPAGSWQFNQPAAPLPPVDQHSGFNSQITVPQDPLDAGLPVDPARQARELAELQQAGFEPAGQGQVVPLYDANGRPIQGSKEWVLQVSFLRPNGYLLIVFHSPSGYPARPPSAQARGTSGGSLRWLEPNTIKDWHVGRLLVEVAREIENDIP